MNRFLLTTCILLIPLGAIGGIFYPVYQAGWSGTLAEAGIPFQNQIAKVEITPAMNPSRLFVKIVYRHDHEVFTNNVGFQCKIKTGESIEFDGQVGFRVDDRDEGGLLRIGDSGTTYLNLRDFDVTEAKQLEVHLQPMEHREISIQSMTLRVRQNVSQVNWAICVVSCLILLLGILGTVFLGIKIVFNTEDEIFELAREAVPELFEDDSPREG
jgi:hypothetical protein